MHKLKVGPKRAVTTITVEVKIDKQSLNALDALAERGYGNIYNVLEVALNRGLEELENQESGGE